MKKYLTIHGHFYQPPRENPWTETIELQPSAQPARDWNVRINSESYLPNGFSRILDASNQIINIVNNYRSINFNFGPTLLSWMQTAAPDTYDRILQADRESIAHYNGHGSAIAQCFNHMIMPLASTRDQHTQIRWGVADFVHRFKRQPDSIWLPETAINQHTLNLLTEYNFKYIILSPHQAERVRELEDPEESWLDVSQGSVDTREAYRCYARNDNGEKIADRYLDIFFYHGELSRAISFEHLLRDARGLSDRISGAFGEGEKDKLVSIGTDGETYGHHERFGDMGLAYLLHVESPARNITPVNYAAFLAEHPPTREVELKPGPDGEGTAWSCAHGVGRWYRDCGCSTGGEYYWNQSWRQPLRDAFDGLRDRLATLTEQEGERLFKDVWQARDAYIDVVLDRSDANIKAFLDRYCHDSLQDRDYVRALELMELQRNAMLMYTSCGWFFTELSGIETVQTLKYAARAIQLAEKISGEDLESAFANGLEQARSNLTQYRDGKWIYQNFVKPAVVDFHEVVNHFAISGQFGALPDDSAEHRIYIYDIQQHLRREYEHEGVAFVFGKVHIRSSLTRAEQWFGYALVRGLSGEQVNTVVREVAEDWDFDQACDQLIDLIDQKPEDLLEALRHSWHGRLFGIGDMFYEERQKVMSAIMARHVAANAGAYAEIFARDADLLELGASLKLPIPDELLAPARLALRQRVMDCLRAGHKGAPLSRYADAIAASAFAAKTGLDIGLEGAAELLQEQLTRSVKQLRGDFTREQARQVLELIEVRIRLGLEIHKTPIQNALHDILRMQVNPAIERVILSNADQETFDLIQDVLRIAEQFNFNTIIYQDRLKPFEDHFQNTSSASLTH